MSRLVGGKHEVKETCARTRSSYGAEPKHEITSLNMSDIKRKIGHINHVFKMYFSKNKSTFSFFRLLMAFCFYLC